MRFKPILNFKYNPKEWHRKFAFLPVKIEDEYHWLCNVYRKQMEFRDVSEKYWAYIPYSSLDLIKQHDLEIQGKFKPKKYTEAERSFISKHYGAMLFWFMIFSIASLTSFAIFNSINRNEARVQLEQKIDKAQTTDELKQILREILTSKQ